MTHAVPPLPQASLPVPAMHCVPWQQPSGQVVESQFFSQVPVVPQLSPVKQTRH